MSAMSVMITLIKFQRQLKTYTPHLPGSGENQGAYNFLADFSISAFQLQSLKIYRSCLFLTSMKKN